MYIYTYIYHPIYIYERTENSFNSSLPNKPRRRRQTTYQERITSNKSYPFWSARNRGSMTSVIPELFLRMGSFFLILNRHSSISQGNFSQIPNWCHKPAAPESYCRILQGTDYLHETPEKHRQLVCWWCSPTGRPAHQQKCLIPMLRDNGLCRQSWNSSCSSRVTEAPSEDGGASRLFCFPTSAAKQHHRPVLHNVHRLSSISQNNQHPAAWNLSLPTQSDSFS